MCLAAQDGRNSRQDVDNPQHGDDQLYLQRRILDDPAPWRIDREAYVFQSLSHAEGDVDRRDYSAEELRPLSADADGNWTTSIEGLVWRPYVRDG